MKDTAAFPDYPDIGLMFKGVRATLLGDVQIKVEVTGVGLGGRKGRSSSSPSKVVGRLPHSRPAAYRACSGGLGVISHPSPDEAALCRPDAGSGLVVPRPQAAHALHSGHYKGRNASRRLISPLAKTAQDLPGDCWTLPNLFEGRTAILAAVSRGTKLVSFRFHFQFRVTRALMV
jgi:hypothetical protein